MKVLSIGFGSSVLISRIIGIFNPDSAPIRRIIQEAKSNGSMIDATYGRKVRAVIVMDNHKVILSAIHAETLMNRLNQEN